MKNKILFMLIFLVTLLISIFTFGPLTNIIAVLLRHEPKIIISSPNAYYKDANYKFVKKHEDFIPYSRQDLKDIFFSILNNGYHIFTFYCPDEYVDCIKDVNTLSSDASTLTNINNYVSPFNNFKNIRVIYDEAGEVTVEIEKLYSAQEITDINNAIDKIINEVITAEMDDEEKILAIHDYIINITTYDLAKIDGNSPYRSNIAYGPLIEGYAVCGGYADAMALFLNRFNIPNFKVASLTHVWNAVYINDIWLHLDLTWDDPVNENDPQFATLNHKFFLITNATLEGYEITEHNFNKSIYQEFAS